MDIMDLLEGGGYTVIGPVATRCNSGETPCSLATSYSLKQAPVSEADVATVAAAVGDVSLPVWAEQCNAVFAECEAKWRETVGVQLGL